MVGKGMAVILVLLTVLALQGAVFLGSVHESFLDKNAYMRLLEENNAYEKIRELIIGQASEQMGTGLPLQAGSITEELLSGLITAEWVKEKIEPLIENFFGYLNGEKDKLNLTINAGLSKEDLLGQKEAIRELAEQKISGIRECSAEELPTLDETGLPACIPPGIDAGALIDQAIASGYLDSPQLKGLFVSQQIDLAQYLGKDIKGNLARAREMVSILSSLTYLLWAMAALFVALLAFVLRNSLKKVPKYLGAGLLVSGAIGAAITFAAGSMAGNITENMASSEGMPPEITGFATSLINGLVQGFAFNVLVKEIIVLAAGAILLAVYFVLAHRKKAKKPVSKETPSPKKVLQKTEEKKFLAVKQKTRAQELKEKIAQNPQKPIGENPLSAEKKEK